MSSSDPSRVFVGYFEPAGVMAEKGYPRLSGAGTVTADDDGLRFEGTAFDTSNPTVVRVAGALLVLVLFVALLLFDDQADMVLGIGVGFILSWSLWIMYRDKMGQWVDVTVPWSDFDRFEAGEAVVVLWIAPGALGAPAVPSPVFFAAGEAAEDLIDEVDRAFSEK